jgi:hypothetical protein
MNALRTPKRSRRNWSAKELRGMPAAGRAAILRAAAKRAESDYRGDHGLTDFEAFGKDDTHAHLVAAALALCVGD